jgi:hypothetical protein
VPKFIVATTTTWLQEYEVEASTAEDASEKVLSGDSKDVQPIHGELLWDTEAIHSIEAAEEE